MRDHEQKARAHEIMLWQRMRPAEKYRQLIALVEMARRYKHARLKALHPDWPSEQIEKAVREAFLYAHT